MLSRRTRKNDLVLLFYFMEEIMIIAPEEKKEKLAGVNTRSRALRSVLRASPIHRPLGNEARFNLKKRN